MTLANTLRALAAATLTGLLGATASAAEGVRNFVCEA